MEVTPKYHPGALISDYTVRLDSGFTVTVKAASRREAGELAERVSRMYQDALIVQDACNLSGVVRSFSKHMQTLCDMGIDNTRDRNRHPVCVLFSSKIASLTGSEDFSNFSRAYGEVKQNVYEAITS